MVADWWPLTICIPGYGICNPPQRLLLLLCGEFESVVNAILDWDFRVNFGFLRKVRIKSVRLLLSNAGYGVDIGLKTSHGSGEEGGKGDGRKTTGNEGSFLLARNGLTGTDR